jgi:hypothetical protein
MDYGLWIITSQCGVMTNVCYKLSLATYNTKKNRLLFIKYID